MVKQALKLWNNNSSRNIQAQINKVIQKVATVFVQGGKVAKGGA